MSTLCTHDIISTLNIDDRCEFVKDNCDSDTINFYALHYCIFQSNFLITLPLYTVFLFILFFLLSDTSNNFLSVALTKITEVLGMSQNLAGVTLLALGNGASDVISSLVASSDTEGIEFSIGLLIGGGLFVTSLGFSLVVFFGKDLRVTPKLFNRDILLYLFSLCFLVLIAYNGKISFLESFGFLGIYCVSVVFAFWQDCREQKENLLLEVNKIDLDLGPLTPKGEENEENMDLVKNEETKKEMENLEEENELKRLNSFIAEMIVNDIKNDQLGKDTNIYTPQFSIGSFIDQNIQALRAKLKKYYFKQKESYNYFILYIVNGTKQHAFIKSSTS